MSGEGKLVIVVKIFLTIPVTVITRKWNKKSPPRLVQYEVAGEKSWIPLPLPPRAKLLYCWYFSTDRGVPVNILMDHKSLISPPSETSRDLESWQTMWVYEGTLWYCMFFCKKTRTSMMRIFEKFRIISSSIIWGSHQVCTNNSHKKALYTKENSRTFEAHLKKSVNGHHSNKNVYMSIFVKMRLLWLSMYKGQWITNSGG